MRIFIIGERLQVTPTNDLKKLLSMMGHEAEVFFPPESVLDIIQDSSFDPIFTNIDKADLVVGLADLNDCGIIYGYAIGREKRLLTQHKYDEVLPNTQRVIGLANIIEWVVNNKE
jgi:hypothetical protein